MSTGSITLHTHLDGGQDSRQIELTEHDTVHSFFEKCAAAWPQTFRTDIKTIFYLSPYNKSLSEICKRSRIDFPFMKKVYRDCLAIGMHPEMHIYISKEIENSDALAASFEGLGL
jgi:hypothetical protein